MSPQIRTPMTASLGFAHLLRENLSSPEDVDAVETVRRNGEHLLEIINGILDLSAIEAGRLRLETIDFSPKEVVAEAISLTSVGAGAKGVKLELRYDGPIPQTIHSDPTRLRQILINLVGNAIKFSELGTVQVLVHLAEQVHPPQLQFDVIDTGIGIGEEQIRDLFKPFSQADSSSSRKFGGTGLGLAISKRLAGLLGGDVSVRSTLGRGSTFSATIATGDLAESQVREPIEEAASVARRDTAKASPTQCLRHLRILLAEDGPDNQRLIALLLRKAGAQVTVVENGAMACEYALANVSSGGKSDLERAEPFDVIVMDMQMPVMDGYEATRMLRSRGYGGPIIALTANAMDSDREKCLGAGCDDYLAKPMRQDALLAVVSRHIRSGSLST